MGSAPGLGKSRERLWHWYKWQGQNFRISAYLFAIRPTTSKLWIAQTLHQLILLHVSSGLTSLRWTIAVTAIPNKSFWELLAVLSSIPGSVTFIPVVPRTAFGVFFKIAYLIYDGQLEARGWFMKVYSYRWWSLYLHAKYSLLSSCMKRRTPRCNFCMLQIELEISSR